MNKIEKSMMKKQNRALILYNKNYSDSAGTSPKSLIETLREPMTVRLEPHNQYFFNWGIPMNEIYWILPHHAMPIVEKRES